MYTTSRISLLIVLAGFVAVSQTHADEDSEQAFGAFVLNVMETAETADSVAEKIRARSIEIRAAMGKEGAVTEEERQWYERHSGKEKYAKPGGGPPPWAPAHGYRRKFGAQEEHDLGAYTHRRIQEGATGYELVIAIRDAVERVGRGEPIDSNRRSATSTDRRQAPRGTEERDGADRRSRDDHPRDGAREKGNSERPTVGKRDGKGRK